MPKLKVYINGAETPFEADVVSLVYEFSAEETGGDAEALVIEHRPAGRLSELKVDGVTGSELHESAEHIRRSMP